MFFDLPFGLQSQINSKEYAIATYYVFGVAKQDILKKAGNFAIGQSVGTWIPLPGVTREMVTDWQARVVGVYPLPSDENIAVIRVAFPLHNFAGNFSMMLTALIGNDVSTAMKVKLVDLEFTQKALDRFVGPKQGIEGFRRITKVEDRPLVLNMIKPCIGFDAEKGAQLFYESGLGGVDLIKDDEVLGNTAISSVVDRVKAYNKAGDMVEKEIGKKPVYIANITDTVKNMRIHAKNIIEEGAQAAMINFIATGADALYEITQEFSDKLCFLAHYAGVGIMNSPRQGIADDVMIGTLARLAGADSVMTMYTKSDDIDGRFECIKTVQKQQLGMEPIKPIMTSLGGGITPASIHEILNNYSNDIIIGVGGAIQGHPMGTVSGARAVMDTLYGAIEGKGLEEICQSNQAVKMAVELWG